MMGHLLDFPFRIDTRQTVFELIKHLSFVMSGILSVDISDTAQLLVRNAFTHAEELERTVCSMLEVACVFFNLARITVLKKI